MLRASLLLLILFLPSVLADSTDASNVRIWCEYPSGNNAYGGGDDICSASGGSDSQISCTADPSTDCAEEGNVVCWFDSTCECPHQTNPGDAYGSCAGDGGNCQCSGGYTWTSTTAYNINYDSDANDCYCLGGVGNCDNGETECWEPDAADCCGDDAGETWCDGAGGWRACVNGRYRTSADSYTDVCTCGGGTWMADGGNENCCGDDAGESFCDNDGGSYVACVNDDYYTNGDSNSYTCECGEGGNQGNCDDGEQGCWAQQVSLCCGDDGAGDDFCGDPGNDYSACVGGTFDDDAADSNSGACGCGDGAWGLDECDSNNEIGCWDSDSGECCGNGGSAESWCDGSSGCGNGTYWTDADSNQFVCEVCDGSIWTGLPGQDACAGDDPGEFGICESTNPWVWDLVDSCGNCNDPNMCVDESVCFADSGTDPVEELEDGMGVDTGDYEICDGAQNNWHDPDESQVLCDSALDYTGNPITATGCDGDSCWMAEGEEAAFGGFQFAANNDSVECCGDDLGEYFIKTNTQTGCCNDTTDFAHSGGVCSRGFLTPGPQGSEQLTIYGYVQGEVPNGSYEPLEDYWLSIKYRNFSTANGDFTDASGWYNISVVAGNYTVFGTKSGHKDIEYDLEVDDHVYKNFTVDLTSDCREDCTRYDGLEYRCDSACDGVNNCTYDPTVISAKYGDTMKNLCHGLLAGWTVQSDADWDIECCSVGFVHTANHTKADVSFDETIRDAQTFFAGTVNYVPTGELYSVYVVVYEKG